MLPIIGGLSKFMYLACGARVVMPASALIIQALHHRASLKWAQASFYRRHQNQNADETAT
jgi:hypothetical protein